MNNCGTIMGFQDLLMTQFLVIPNSVLSLNVKLLMFECWGLVDNRIDDEDNSLYNLEK